VIGLDEYEAGVEIRDNIIPINISAPDRYIDTENSRFGILSEYPKRENA
jgi:hypothetical protein